MTATWCSARKGRIAEVTRKFAYNQTDPMVEVRVKHSIAPLKVTAGHPLWAIRGIPMEQATSRSYDWLAKGKTNPEWVDAGDLQTGDYVAQVIPQEVVPVAGFDEDDARMYGILLGDGPLREERNRMGRVGQPDARRPFGFRGQLSQRPGHSLLGDRPRRALSAESAGRQALASSATARTGQYRGAGLRNLEFIREDLYGSNGQKRIARRFSHLPKSQTLALLQGLLETDGGVSRGKEIYFTSTSEALAEGVRYQMLRLGVPTAGQYRERRQDHEATRDDGSRTEFKGTVKGYDIRIPAVPEPGLSGSIAGP